MSVAGYSHLVRIAGTDIRGEYRLDRGLADIKGVNRRLARVLCQKAGIPPEKRTGYLQEEEIKRIEAILSDLQKHGVPHWFHNRQRDRVSGKNLHLTGADLLFAIRQDIDFLKRLKTIRGIRHSRGLKTRGQRTRSNGRKGRTLGVSRKR